MLDKDQVEIFNKIIDDFREVLRDKRSDFIAYRTGDGIFHIQHPYKPDKELSISSRDFFDLSNNGLIDTLFLESPTSCTFSIPLEAFELFKELKLRIADPIEIIENRIYSFIYSEDFKEKYINAYNKWREAEKLFSDSEVEKYLSTIGLLCREAMQEFVSHLISIIKPLKIEGNPTQIKLRLSSIVKASKKMNSDSGQKLLMASLEYWDRLNDFVQRQTHSGRKEDERVTILDGKRILLHTAFLFFELDQLLLT